MTSATLRAVLRSNTLSGHVFDTGDAIVSARCVARNPLVAQPGRITTQVQARVNQ